jgi:hypothetical protein
MPTMRFFRLSTAFFWMLFLVGPAFSQGLSDSSVPAAMAPVNVWTSQAGESKDDFVRRVASAVYPITLSTGFEVCGTLMVSTDGQRFRLPIVTDRSQIGCRMLPVAQAGFVLEAHGETFHTHPRGSSFLPNAQDKALMPIYQGNPGLRYPVDGDKFSDRDMGNGPGYVVASGGHPFGKPHVLYQRGAGSVREVGTLKGFSAAQLAPDRDTADYAMQVAQAQKSTVEISAVSVSP